MRNMVSNGNFDFNFTIIGLINSVKTIGVFKYIDCLSHILKTSIIGQCNFSFKDLDISIEDKLKSFSLFSSFNNSLSYHLITTMLLYDNDIVLKFSRHTLVQLNTYC